MKTTCKLCFTAVLATFSIVSIASSATGTIRGEAKPREQIVVVNDDSGVIVGVMADAAGHFEATALPVGEYKVARAHSPARATGAPVMAGRVTDVVLPAE